MKPLTKQICVACEGIGKPLQKEEISLYLQQVPKWTVIEKKKIQRTIECKDFTSVIKLVNTVANLAEKEGHHPDMRIFSWNKLEFTLYTHALKGLSVNDFILAAKINEILSIN